MIRDGIEYRMFFEHRTAEDAVKACKDWGKEWKSEVMTTNLMKDINRELQECLKNMISTHEFYGPNNNKDAIGYFIGGETENITKDIDHNTTGWHWKSGNPIATTNEVSAFLRNNIAGHVFCGY